MRRIKTDVPKLPSSGFDPHSGRVKESYEIHLVTPIFGGGAVAGQPDHDFPIRPTSIRGHLRFWWRATRGARFGSPRELLRKENKIFGSVSLPSPLGVRVSPIDPVLTQESPRIPRYVAFPYRGAETQAQSEFPLAFRLEVGYPESRKEELALELRSALWAWVNFGGLGARSRRGCGALWCQALSPSNPSLLSKWFSAQASELEIPCQQRPWPTLPRGFLTSQKSDVADAWTRSIEPLEEFRQVPLGRPSFKARSHWPEAETIRREVGARKNRHHAQPNKPKGFPRAELGLPIVFQFKDGPKKEEHRYNKGSDPPVMTLCPASGERMASPLIIKPLALGLAHAVPILLLLKTPDLEKVRLDCVFKAHEKQVGFTGQKYSRNSIRSPRLAAYPSSPLRNYSTKGSAIEAFLRYVKSKGYQEVRR